MKGLGTHFDQVPIAIAEELLVKQDPSSESQLAEGSTVSELAAEKRRAAASLGAKAHHRQREASRAAKGRTRVAKGTK
jgi:hypothetical protein